MPPKYGRVMRSNTPVKVPSTTAGVQLPSEKKVGTVDPKVNQQNITANGSSDKKIPAQTGSVAPGSNKVDLAEGLKSLNVNNAQKNNLTVISKDIDENLF